MPPDQQTGNSRDLPRSLNDDLLAGVPDSDRRSLEAILRSFAEECQRRFVTRRSSSILYRDEGYEQSLSETDLDAWMSCYTTEIAHGEVKKTITRTEASSSSATAIASHAAVPQGLLGKVETPNSTIDPVRKSASKSATTWYDDIDEDQNIHNDLKTVTNDDNGTDNNIEFNNKGRRSSSWLNGDRYASNGECHTESNDEDKEDNEEHMTSWYADNTEPSSESTSQIYQ